MVLSNNLNPGMTVSIGGKLYRVESSIKVTVPKGTPFIKAKLRDINTNQVVEKNFKPDQSLKDVSSAEQRLEFLYMEGKDYLFLNVDTLEQVIVPQKVIGNKAHYLKEGIELLASLMGESVFAVELPQFLEIMVAKVEGSKATGPNGSRVATLETGAKLEVPPFIEAGDVIKVDTKADEYIQRV